MVRGEGRFDESEAGPMLTIEEGFAPIYKCALHEAGLI